MKTEIERRWRLPKVSAPSTDADIITPTHTMTVYHWYLKVSKNFQVRVGAHLLTSRAGDSPSDPYPVVFVYNMKKGEGLARQEGEFCLTNEQFNAIVKMCDFPGDPIVKEYTFYLKDGYEFEVCQIDGGLVLVEVEFPSCAAAEEFDMDKYYPEAVEVTDDPSFSMKEYWRRSRGEKTPDNN